MRRYIRLLLFEGIVDPSPSVCSSLFVSYLAIAADYHNYQVLNSTEISPFYANETELERLLAIAEGINPGGIKAVSGYIEPFLKRGKLLSYVGLADRIIPARSSICQSLSSSSHSAACRQLLSSD